MKKIYCMACAALFSVTLFAKSGDSFDGLISVARKGDLPQGHFGKAVGYLPGDSVSITNPVTGVTLQILNLGTLDKKGGVALLISEESAKSLGIDSSSEIHVRLADRYGSFDESVAGSAILARNDLPKIGEKPVSEIVQPEPENKLAKETSAADKLIEEIAAQETGKPVVNEAAVLAEMEENMKENSMAESEDGNPSEKNVEEPEPVPENEDAAESPEENPSDDSKIVDSDADSESEVADGECENPSADEVKNENAETVSPEEDDEEILPSEEEIIEIDETAEDEEVPEEKEGEPVEKLPDENCEEPVKEEIAENSDSKVSAEEEPEASLESSFLDVKDEIEHPSPIDEDLEMDEKNQVEAEPVVEETAPVAEEKSPVAENPLPAAEKYEDENLVLVPAESMEPEYFNVEEKTEEISEEPVVEEVIEEVIPVEKPAPVAETPEPEKVEEVLEEESVPLKIIPRPVVVEDEFVEIPVVPLDRKVSEEKTSPVEGIKEFEKYIVSSESCLMENSYYVQIASMKNVDNINALIKKYSSYPLILIPVKDGIYRILIGPLNIDEYEVVLTRFKAFGFKDAFMRKK